MSTKCFPFFLSLLFTGLLCAQQPDTLLHRIPPPSGANGDAQLGFSVAVDGGYTVVGAPADYFDGPLYGAVKVFDSVTGELMHVIRNPRSFENDQFGSSVAISGTRLVVGVPDDDTGAFGAGSAYVYDLGSSTPTVPVYKLNNPGPAVFEYFGYSVAISGTRVVVGAYGDYTGGFDAGSAYVYDLSSGTPTVPVHTLNNPSPAASERFGYSVAISGSRLVVGDPGYGFGVNGAGSAYVYDLGSGTPTLPVHTLNYPDPAAGDYFGTSVAISGTRVVVGASQDDTGGFSAGIAYVYDLGSGTPTVPVHTLNNPDPAEGDRFGFKVSISGVWVVVGAHQDDTGATDAGSAYVYDLGSGTPTVPVHIVNNPGPAVDDRYGWSVAISGTRVVVGAYQDNTRAPDAGSAYAYDLGSDTPTVPVHTLNNPSPSIADQFGIAVSISGSRLMVGAHEDDTGTFNAGSAYVYDLSSGMPTVPVHTLINPDPAGNDRFGRSVAISGLRAVVGAYLDDTGASNAGTMYAYDLASGTPTLPSHTLNNPSPAMSDFFGYSVAMAGTLVVVGAHLDDTVATDAGTVYIYDLASSTPTLPAFTLHNPGPAAGDLFGVSVAISGTRVVVGAHHDDTGATNAGSAYIYDLDSGTPTVPKHTLNNPDPAAGDSFGISVAISGTRAVVGAYLDDTGAVDAGSAYVYDISSGTPTVPVSTLNNPGPAMNDRFGGSVAISGLRVGVGAYLDDTGAVDAGSAYEYDLSGGMSTVPVAPMNNPGPASGDNFGYSVAIDGSTAAIGTPFDDSVMSDKGYAYVFELSDLVTAPPVLTAPSGGLVTTSPINVSFTLPEAALPGSVKLAFGATELTLGSGVEGAGTHSFSFDPTHPTATSEIASGGPVADGTYTVTLSYQDFYGNPVASVLSTSVTVDSAGPLGGTVVLSPGSAVAPSTLMTVDLAGWTDERLPLSYALLVDDVVVSAAGPGSTRNFTAPAFAGAFTLKARIADSLGNTTTVLRSFHTGISPQQGYDNATTAAGLTGPDAQATATLYQGDVSNLLKYAFNLNLTTPDRRTLTPGSGMAGLPVITRPAPGIMRLEYVRRIGSGLIYTPQKRAALDGGTWVPLTALPVLTPIDTNWERIHHDEPFNLATTDGMFGRVEVTLP